jgi:superfamily I DNA/RNA helicase
MNAISAANLESRQLANTEQMKDGAISIMTMHNAKGLEFRTVAVMACDDEILPLQERIAAAADDSDLEEV